MYNMQCLALAKCLLNVGCYYKVIKGCKTSKQEKITYTGLPRKIMYILLP